MNANDMTIRQWLEGMTSGQIDGKPITSEGIMLDLRDLDAAKARMKKLLGIEGKIASPELFNLAADEIETLRVQVQALTADAIIRAHRQCIAIDALIAIRDRATNESTRQIAERAIAQIEVMTP